MATSSTRWTQPSYRYHNLPLIIVHHAKCIIPSFYEFLISLHKSESYVSLCSKLLHISPCLPFPQQGVWSGGGIGTLRGLCLFQRLPAAHSLRPGANGTWGAGASKNADAKLQKPQNIRNYRLLMTTDDYRTLLLH